MAELLQPVTVAYSPRGKLYNYLAPSSWKVKVDDHVRGEGSDWGRVTSLKHEGFYTGPCKTLSEHRPKVTRADTIRSADGTITVKARKGDTVHITVLPTRRQQMYNQYGFGDKVKAHTIKVQV